MNKRKYFLIILLMLTSTTCVVAQPNIEKSIECRLDVTVVSSRNFQNPVTQHTSIKNDGYPMLLIGIKIQNAEASNASKHLKKHRQYCSKLIGQQKDAYLSGPHEQNKNTIHIGDRLILRNIHSSGKHYPYWSEFYFIEKRGH